jgi:hypothetical protein
MFLFCLSALTAYSIGRLSRIGSRFNGLQYGMHSIDEISRHGVAYSGSSLPRYVKRAWLQASEAGTEGYSYRASWDLHRLATVEQWISSFL